MFFKRVLLDSKFQRDVIEYGINYIEKLQI